MTARTPRHRAACRPSTPLTVAAKAVTSPEARRKAAILASSGLAVGLIAAQGVGSATAETKVGAEAGVKAKVVTANAAVTAPQASFEISQAKLTVVEPKAAPAAAATGHRAATGGGQSAAAAVDYSTIPAANGSIAAIAQQYLGVPYVYGGSSPASGFDCSGFVKYVYAQAGIGVSGRTDASIAAGGAHIPLSAAQPGDILWHSGHVGIYLGDGMYIHAPHPGTSVSIAPVKYGGFTTAVRY